MSLFSTDPTLTHANVSTVTATVPLEGNELGEWVLVVPVRKRKEIHQQSSTAAQEREGLIRYYLSYSPYASWSRLASRLYRGQYHDALSAARRFIGTEPGEFMFTFIGPTLRVHYCYSYNVFAQNKVVVTSQIYVHVGIYLTPFPSYLNTYICLENG